MSYWAEARSAAMTAATLLALVEVLWGTEGYAPVPEPAEATRKARNGTVRALKLGNLRLARATAAPPAASPTMPPTVPPLTVALRLR
jgi:hypothetical protein